MFFVAESIGRARSLGSTGIPEGLTSGEEGSDASTMGSSADPVGRRGNPGLLNIADRGGTGGGSMLSPICAKAIQYRCPHSNKKTVQRTSCPRLDSFAGGDAGPVSASSESLSTSDSSSSLSDWAPVIVFQISTMVPSHDCTSSRVLSGWDIHFNMTIDTPFGRGVCRGSRVLDVWSVGRGHFYAVRSWGKASYPASVIVVLVGGWWWCRWNGR